VCYWQHDIENSYKYIATTFSILIYLNAILFFLFPDGLWIDHNWQGTGDSTRHLFGNYNQTGFVCLIGITAQAMYTLTTKRGVLNLFALIIVSLGSVIYIGSMTSSIGLSILAIYIIFHKFIKRPKIYLSIFTVLYVLFFAVIIWYGNSIEEISLMTKFIENILSKDTTFTSRTYIWSNAVYKIQQSPWIGYGLQDVKWNMTYLAGSGPHNLLLTLLLQGGVILCGGFLINIIYVVREALKATNGVGVLGVVSICVLLLMSLFEAYNIVQTFLFLQLVYYSPLLYNYESRS
jgi:O-antigen ligase